MRDGTHKYFRVNKKAGNFLFWAMGAIPLVLLYTSYRLHVSIATL